MPRRRMDTRTIREILRLKSLNLSVSKISQSTKASVGSVHGLIQKAEKAGLKWPLPEDFDDQKLEGILYPRPEVVVFEGKALPDFSHIEKEIIRKGVTRQRLFYRVNQIETSATIKMILWGWCYSVVRIFGMYAMADGSSPVRKPGLRYA